MGCLILTSEMTSIGKRAWLGRNGPSMSGQRCTCLSKEMKKCTPRLTFLCQLGTFLWLTSRTLGVRAWTHGVSTYRQDGDQHQRSQLRPQQWKVGATTLQRWQHHPSHTSNQCVRFLLPMPKLHRHARQACQHTKYHHLKLDQPRLSVFFQGRLQVRGLFLGRWSA